MSMFDFLSQLFNRESGVATGQPAGADLLALTQWASQQGLRYSAPSKPGRQTSNAAPDCALEGDLNGKTWQLEWGKSERDFVQGQELRGKSDLGVLDSVAVFVMSRELKADLEKQAYAMYTDDLQTVIDPKLPEEMRWLAIYPEVAWTGLPTVFLERYCVLAAKKEYAQAWLDAATVQAILACSGQTDRPMPMTKEVPFVMGLLRGRWQLRVECSLPTLARVQLAVNLCRVACSSALTNVAQREVDWSVSAQC
jgi:hypothetical protein